ncbi:cellular nucleic acid-binding protein isoform X1 [Cygnus olor]|uniref:cellular nucleic acid-binding protein isoform X1 n=1 Tax=Cygnus olor TaxID=8869 RepID=UPI001ADE9202|nr:cellular nucleic acid-binding protein isoform X1 [Cygnus olor]
MMKYIISPSLGAVRPVPHLKWRPPTQPDIYPPPIDPPALGSFPPACLPPPSPRPERRAIAAAPPRVPAPRRHLGAAAAAEAPRPGPAPPPWGRPRRLASVTPLRPPRAAGSRPPVTKRPPRRKTGPRGRPCPPRRSYPAAGRPRVCKERAGGPEGRGTCPSDRLLDSLQAPSARFHPLFHTGSSNHETKWQSLPAGKNLHDMVKCVVLL